MQTKKSSLDIAHSLGLSVQDHLVLYSALNRYFKQEQNWLDTVVDMETTVSKTFVKANIESCKKLIDLFGP